MAWSDDLVGVAYQIANSNENPLRVIAGPGTGKSFALKRRIARLLEEGENPEKILAVTFTRNAALSLVEDLKSINISGCEKIKAMTLHSYCFSLLIKNEVFNTLSRHPRPLISFFKSKVYQFEVAPMLEDINSISDDFKGKRASSKRILAFEAAWARLQHEIPGWPVDPIDKRFHMELLNWLKSHDSILIGELIPLALHYLRNNPASSELTSYKHILVDEYQDLNRAEQVLIDILSRNSAFSLVGDADQSIYSFRHAHPHGIIEFNETHPSTHDESLRECRRCPTDVVNLANNLIMNNHSPSQDRILFPLTSNIQGEVAIVQWDSIDSEIIGISKYCHYLLSKCGYSPKEILIISPRRLLGYKLRHYFTELNIPNHSFYHEESLEDEEAQVNFTLLRLLVNIEDKVSLRYWLGAGSKTWNSGSYRHLYAYARDNSLTVRQALESIISNQISLPRLSKLVNRYLELKRRIEELKPLLGINLINNLFPDSVPWSFALREAALSKIDNSTDASKLLKILLDQIIQPEMPEDGDYIKIMSLHKAKGLTSRVVILNDCIEGLIPNDLSDYPQADQEELLKEQRRLFYVALTRCREKLVLSSVSTIEKRLAFKIGAAISGKGSRCRTITTRFINELGPTAPSPLAGDVWLNSIIQ